MNKDSLREKYKVIRQAIPNKKELSEKIVGQILTQKVYQDAKQIGFYYPLQDEVDVLPLAFDALSDNKQIAFPKTGKKEMDYCTAESLDQLDHLGLYGIMEPSGSPVISDSLDLIIVPMIAFDITLNRLGYGKGYYDRYLKKCPAVKMGVAFHATFIDGALIDISDHDIRLDMIVSEKKIFRR